METKFISLIQRLNALRVVYRPWIKEKSRFKFALNNLCFVISQNIFFISLIQRLNVLRDAIQKVCYITKMEADEPTPDSVEDGLKMVGYYGFPFVYFILWIIWIWLTNGYCPLEYFVSCPPLIAALFLDLGYRRKEVAVAALIGTLFRTSVSTRRRFDVNNVVTTLKQRQNDVLCLLGLWNELYMTYRYLKGIEIKL